MKITILIMTVCLLQVSALTKAQISIDAKQESLREVLKKISQQSGYDFIYSVSDFKDAKPVDLKLNNVSLDLALRAAFYSQPLIYEVSDQTVMVRKKEEKSYIQTVIDRFQNIDVRGKVVDSLGNGLPGATVSVKGGKGSTSTDNEGNFFLRNIEEGSVLVITYLGYLTKEQLVNKDFNYIILQQSQSKLDEVQIMGYGVTSRRLSTGNITTIKADEIARQPVDNPLLALMGRVPNLQITPGSGLPGTAVSIQLRGQNSLARNRVFGTLLQSEPLFVIDGVPFSNNFISGSRNNSALSFINPSDIESIDVLSDADATAIYGSRGGNGVILITTKRGKAGKTSITASSYFGFSEVAGKLALMNTEQYLDMRYEAMRNDNITPQIINKNLAGYAPDLLLWDKTRYTDWQEVFLGHKAIRNRSQASMSGGNALIQYLVSGTYQKQGYVFTGDAKDESGTGHFSLTGTSPNNKLRATLTGSYMSNFRLSPSTDYTALAVTLAPNAPALYQENGTLNWESNPNIAVGSATWNNPYASLLRTVESKAGTLNTNSELSYEIIPGLMIKSAIGFSDMKYNALSILPVASFDPSLASNAKRGTATRYNNNSRSWTLEPQLTYHRNIGKGQFSGLFGFSLQSSSYESADLTARGYADDALIKSLGAAQVVNGIPAFSSFNTSSEYKYTALFSRLNYNWGNKYILNLSGRRDGSSRFGPQRPFGNFWSLGTAWLFGNEHLIKDNFKVLSYGKVRMSYGASGNDNIQDYQYLQLYQPLLGPDTQSLQYQDIPTIFTPGTINSYYSWEDVKKLETAVELGFFKDRLLLTTAYWRTRSDNQLGSVILPATAGNDEIVTNQVAKIQNSGLDVTLNSQNFTSETFKWSTSLNIGLQRNKLLAVPNEEFWGFYRPPYPAGVDPVGLPFFGFEGVREFMGVNSINGLYQFKDKGGNPSQLETETLAKTVSVLPKYSGGVSNQFVFNGFTLDLFFQFVKQKGRDYLFSGGNVFGKPGNWTSSGVDGNLPLEYLDRWRNAGDLSPLQRVSANNSFSSAASTSKGFANNSDYAYVDASFIRLQNLQLAYDFPKKLLQKIKLQSLKVYLQGQNLWTITGYRGLDPQIQNPAALPLLRTFTTGIQLAL